LPLTKCLLNALNQLPIRSSKDLIISSRLPILADGLERNKPISFWADSTNKPPFLTKTIGHTQDTKQQEPTIGLEPMTSFLPRMCSTD
jgi:hypothetical protein